MNDPIGEQIVEQRVPRAEERVEQLLNRVQIQHGFTLHHPSGRHPPPPVFVVLVRFQNGSDREANLIKEIGQFDRRLSTL